MKIIVLKFGGSSVGTIDRIKKIANIVIGYKKKGYKPIVISSAMSGTTNELIKKSRPGYTQHNKESNMLLPNLMKGK